MRGKPAKRLEWSARAAHDLLAIEAYIAVDNPVAAGRVEEYIIERTELLCEHPFLGRAPAASKPRRLVLTRYPYNVHYRVTSKKIRVVRVLHQALRFP